MTRLVGSLEDEMERMAVSVAGGVHACVIWTRQRREGELEDVDIYAA